MCPSENPGWKSLADGYAEAAERIHASSPDILIIYSTLWPSIIGHQIQARPEPDWVLVDPDFHALGSVPYKLRIDADFAHAWHLAAKGRGLISRTVDYHGFPIDTGSVIALELLTPNKEIPAVIVSSNIYADRAETTVLAKSCLDTLKSQGKTAVGVAVMSLSNRFFTDPINAIDDRIHSAKDEEWNQKILEFLADGRLEDVAQLSREIHKQVRVPKVVNFKPAWFLSALCGATNSYEGHVHAYAPIHGTGAAVVSLWPSEAGTGMKEYDEDEIEVWSGDREVLAEADSTEQNPPLSLESKNGDVVHSDAAPAPVGAYPHARHFGDLILLSGVGPRQSGSDTIPGGPRWGPDGRAGNYDIRAQTDACIDNVQHILESAGASLGDVVDITAFLVDMDRDFSGFNEVYGKRLGAIAPTRTTIEVGALPTPIAVELKVLAKRPL